MISIEDPLDEEDFDGFALLQNTLPNIKIIGDDLTVTNKDRLEKAIENKSIKGIIIKPNQIGTLTEAIETIRLARDNDIDCIISHRSGETMDTFISDLVYAFKCFGIKAGALGPKERDVKYERLINIIE
jgi:enolase